ncbi:hypothetical protein NC653_029223 [Populus alba x Populus x berolinensis]|uniref:Uncharacterized protein n=1 Tax=Populus alba x Populus x berolinensis TaxID=444605 RepID=A0AAD6M2N0_9ROSI|nr:hypothetical protein NC653_029223 [Populus alba x Populus x berolinensis]
MVLLQPGEGLLNLSVVHVSTVAEPTRQVAKPCEVACNQRKIKDMDNCKEVYYQPFPPHFPSLQGCSNFCY